MPSSMRGGEGAGVAIGTLAVNAGFGTGIVVGMGCVDGVAFPNPGNAAGGVCRGPSCAADAKGGVALGDVLA